MRTSGSGWIGRLKITILSRTYDFICRHRLTQNGTDQIKIGPISPNHIHNRLNSRDVCPRL